MAATPPPQLRKRIDLMFAVQEPGSIPVAYRSWMDWREDRQRATCYDPVPLVPIGVSFCASCWGQGRTWSQARNGEGLVPVTCAGCDGEGVVRRHR